MTKKLLLFVVIAFATTHLMAQDQKFSAQINVGYTFFSGKKPKNFGENSKYAYGTLSNGQIPIELELRYRVIPQFAINFSYGYGIGLPYSEKTTDEFSTITNKSNLSTHGLSLGGMYYFTKESKFKPYVGLDFQLLLSKINFTYSETVSEETTTNTFKTNVFANFGLSPKVGFEYNFSDKVYLNAAIHYQLIVPSKVTSTEDGEKTTFLEKGDQTITNGIGVKVGVGFRF